MRKCETDRTVWVEAESKKIGDVQLPEALFEAMHNSPVVHVSAPMAERVTLWREDYSHFAKDPLAMVAKLEPLKPLVGGDTLAQWNELAASGRVDQLFESVMVRHYDRCYVRPTRRNYERSEGAVETKLLALDERGLNDAARQLVALG